MFFTSRSPTELLASLRHRDLLRLSLILTVGAFAADVVTKTLATELLRDGGVPLGPLLLEVARNEAFAFSSGGNAPPWLVLLVRGLGVLAIFTAGCIWGRGHRRYALGFALILAGGAGNAVDMVLRGGAVVDFISTGPIHFGADQAMSMTFVFNLADVWILIGLVLVFPLLQQLGRAVQRRMAAFEARLLGRLG